MPFFLTTLLTAYDSALVGASLAVVAWTSWVNYLVSSDTLRQIHDIPSVRISDLRSLLEDQDEKLVFVSGRVQVKRLRGLLALLAPDNYGALRSRSRIPAVIVEQRETDLFGVCGLFKECWSSVRSVPFVLAEGSKRHGFSYLHVSLRTPIHPLPLAHHDVHPVHSASYLSIWNTLMTRVGILKEESILPIGKEITAVGICRKRDGALEIRSCMQLPYFLSDMTKIEIEADLAHQTEFLFWTGIVLGTLSISILGYAVIRNWQRWKDIRNGGWNQESFSEEVVHRRDNDELCVICLERGKTTSLCGHYVCCQYCATGLQMLSCPVCQQAA